MDQRQTKKKWQQILGFIEKKQLKEAFDGIKELLAVHHNWTISERLSQLETNYQYMIHYLLQGKDDPEQERVYRQLICDTYTLADDTAEMVLMENTSSLFFDKLRANQVRTPVSVDEYRHAISKLIDTFSVIELLEKGDDKEASVKQNEQTYEHTLQDLFYVIFSSPRSNKEQIASFERFLSDALIPVRDKCMFVSALTLNVLQRFDAPKVLLLLRTCKHEEVEVASRSVIGIIPIFQKYTNRWSLYPECVDYLSFLSDDEAFERRFMFALLQFIQARETEKITRKMKDEIIPEMMKISPMIGKKIRFDEWMGETAFDDKNPEWQKLFDDTGLTDKLQEFSEMQLEGADVFHSTFSNLKTYPFFNEMSNWFLPFNSRHSLIRGLFGADKDTDSLLKTLSESPLICNSDKYSFCFSVMLMPTQYRQMMISQLDGEAEEMRKLQEEEFALRPHQKEETICKQYLHDLYRFFKLYSRRRELTDIFELPLNYHRIDAFHTIVYQRENLDRIASCYFDKNCFPEAYEAFMKLSELSEPNSEIWQKIGYAKQMQNDIKGALEAYLHADLIADSNTWVLKRIAQCYRLLKEPQKALDYYLRLKQLCPDDLNIQINIGHCHMEMNDYETALNDYFKVELLNGENTRAWRSIAWCALLSRKFDLSQRYYAQIMDRNPQAHDYLNAGHVELCLKNIKKTVEFYTLSVKKTGSLTAFKAMLFDDEGELRQVGAPTELLPIICDVICYEIDKSK